MKNLIKTIQNAAFQQGLWQRGSKIVLGVSGGPDSVCMLDIMAKIAPKYDLQLIIAHINYGLRGKDSDKDEEFVRKLAGKYGIQIFTLILPHPPAKPHPALRATLSLKKERKIRKIHSENELRNIRYEFFEKVRKQNKLDLIAVAHNADDQVETFLMRLIRGAGLQGLSGMKYKNEKIIRPLLGISRKEILGYLDKTNRTYRADRTNAENLFLRNKIRNKLIPYLKKNFNPGIKKTILDSAVSIADDYSLLSDIAEKEAEKMKNLSVKKLLNLHPSLQKMALLNFIFKIKGNLKDIESAHVEEILKAVKSTKSKNQIVIFKGLKLTRKGDKIIISHNL
ncbi:MAG: tRNA lysidine(34) synthetase TilS [Candidatus Moranbacteria bacterium RIFCSPHIGHO2_02_FULL_40_12b]|nr:MAG: tRNA lysidine(34) synthetase TilS [Candidatus Moranbacteria bacterium RIFCSPHIGHO2_02_FULL_40_12b]